jgi:hypothetical protein
MRSKLFTPGRHGDCRAAAYSGFTDNDPGLPMRGQRQA